MSKLIIHNRINKSDEDVLYMISQVFERFKDMKCEEWKGISFENCIGEKFGAECVVRKTCKTIVIYNQGGE